MENLFILIPFGLYGLFKFTKWWIKMTWQKKTDIYNTDDDCFSILPTIVSMLWTVTTVMYLSSEIPKEIMFNYILFTFFGPFTIILGLKQIKSNKDLTIKNINFEIKKENEIGTKIACHINALTPETLLLINEFINKDFKIILRENIEQLIHAFGNINELKDLKKKNKM